MPLFRVENRVLLFVHIPKTGGTSIEKWLKVSGGVEAMRFSERVPGLPCTPQHFHAEILTRILPVRFADFAFTVVRNPFDRLVSEYKMRTLAADRQVDFDTWLDRAFMRYARNPFVFDNHIRMQSDFLFDGLEIFRFEDNPMLQLHSRLSAMGVTAGPDMPWERRSAETTVTASPQTAERIRAFYAADFDRLGYHGDDLGSLVLAEKI